MRRTDDYGVRDNYGGVEPIFKSKGESKIAYFLDDNLIKYQYEPGVLVKGKRDKNRIWYPDFYLPEFKSYIEYYGMTGSRAYAHGIKAKEAVYKQMGMDVISVYPWMFRENWKGYVMRELERNTARKYKSLMAKPYWLRNRIQPKGFYSQSGYHRRFGRRY